MRRLVYDLGVHRGEDTAFYLRRGFDVVGVEPNPCLVQQLRETFAAELQSGQFRLVDKAIGAQRGRGRMLVGSVSVWGTLTEAFAHRNARSGADTEEVEVECVPFDDILREHGVPYYLKMDIEGAERFCLQALSGFNERPEFLSLESCATSPGNGFVDTLREVRILRSLGYRRFNYCDQATIPGRTLDLIGEGTAMRHTFPTHSSGPFGRDLQVRWLGPRAAAAQGLVLRAIDDVCGHSGRLRGRRGMYRMGQLRARLTGCPEHWYDLHAAR